MFLCPVVNKYINMIARQYTKKEYFRGAEFGNDEISFRRLQSRMFFNKS
jgi:hypothetical protein